MWRDQSISEFGENRVRVDVPFPRERISVALPAIGQQGVRRGQRLLITVV